MSNQVRPIVFPNAGVLEYKLNKSELDYVWKCVENKKGDVKKNLVGHITGSYGLEDPNDQFFQGVLLPLINAYGQMYMNLGETVPVVNVHPWCMKLWWVNYQNQGEYNPLHDHTGVYSFVIWLKIPFDWEEQNENPLSLDSNASTISDFSFVFTDILGRVRHFPYRLSRQHEGILAFFPSQLKHQVHPFYNCDDTRISISGNILIDTSVTDKERSEARWDREHPHWDEIMQLNHKLPVTGRMPD